MLCLICLLKGKVITGVIGIVIGPVALVGAIRLAKPGSWWAVRRYPTRPRRADRAACRYDQRRLERWDWLRDLVAGAPTPENQPDPAASAAKCRLTGSRAQPNLQLPDPVRPVRVSGTFTSPADRRDHILHFGGWSSLSQPSVAMRPD